VAGGGLEGARHVDAVLAALTAHGDDATADLVVVLEHDVLDRLAVGAHRRAAHVRAHPVVLRTSPTDRQTDRRHSHYHLHIETPCNTALQYYHQASKLRTVQPAVLQLNVFID